MAWDDESPLSRESESQDLSVDDLSCYKCEENHSAHRTEVSYAGFITGTDIKCRNER